MNSFFCLEGGKCILAPSNILIHGCACFVDLNLDQHTCTVELLTRWESKTINGRGRLCTVYCVDNRACCLVRHNGRVYPRYWPTSFYWIIGNPPPPTRPPSLIGCCWPNPSRQLGKHLPWRPRGVQTLFLYNICLLYMVNGWCGEVHAYCKQTRIEGLN